MSNKTIWLPDNPVVTAQLSRVGIMPSDRQRVYYTVCVPLRLALAGLVYQYRDHPRLSTILVPICLLAVYNLVGDLNNPHPGWWSRRFHLLISILILGICLHFTDHKHLLGYLALVDVGVGVVHSLFVARSR